MVRLLAALRSRAAPFARQPLHAADLSIALGADVTSIDPHFHNLTPNNNVGDHIFETLVGKDARGRLIPALAESWRTVDDLTWEFKLRKGVKFHDGSDFTAADVAFSLDRVPTVPNSPSPFTTYSKQITEKIIVDPLTIRLKTATPYPLMPNDMGTILIVSSRAAKGASTEDFNSGKATIGTGPFRFVRWQKGDRIELARYDGYWGPKAPWDRVIFRVITSDPTRVASLLAGEVRAIENVPTADLAKVSQERRPLGLSRRFAPRDVRAPRQRARQVAFRHRQGGQAARPQSAEGRARAPRDVQGDQPPGARRARHGRRRARDRPAHARRACSATRPRSSPSRYDPEGARKLLAEAGYPDGFGLTIHGPNNRYVNDEQVTQAIAQMLTRVGIVTKVDTMPSAVYFTRGEQARVQRDARRLGLRHRRSLLAAEGAARDLQQRQRHGAGEPRPLLEPEDGRAARPGARDGGRREAREAAAAGDRGRDDRRRHHHALPPGNPVAARKGNRRDAGVPDPGAQLQAPAHLPGAAQRAVRPSPGRARRREAADVRGQADHPRRHRGPRRGREARGRRGRGLLLEGDPRLRDVHRVRSLPGPVPGLEHREAAVAEADDHGDARRVVRQGAVLHGAGRQARGPARGQRHPHQGGRAPAGRRHR